MRTAYMAEIPDPLAVSGVSAVLGAAGLWLANRLVGKAAVQTALNAGFKSMMDTLREERDSIAAQLRAERAEWLREKAYMQGEIRQLQQINDSMRRWLRSQGIEVPDPPAVIDLTPHDFEVKP